MNEVVVEPDTRVDNVEDDSVPFHFCDKPIARRSRDIIHDSKPFPGKTVEQR